MSVIDNFGTFCETKWSEKSTRMQKSKILQKQSAEFIGNFGTFCGTKWSEKSTRPQKSKILQKQSAEFVDAPTKL